MIDLRKKDAMVAAIEEILQQEALKGNQHKIDKNKNNKIDGEDFKILRGEKKAVKKEEVEQIDEVYDAEHFKYINSKEGDKHFEDGHATMMKHIGDDFQKVNARSHTAHAFKQNPHKKGTKEYKAWHHGADAARDEHIGSLQEEIKPIEELSKSTLGSYVKGAARDVGASRKLAADFEHDAKSARKQSAKDANTRLADRFKATAMKRHAGIGKAVERLTKEDVEQIEEALEELTPSKHGSFSVNSKVSATKQSFHKGQHVGMDTLVHKGTIQHKDNSKPSKFEVHNHINRGLTFQTHHSDEEKHAIKQHLIKNKMANKHTDITEEVEQIDELSKETLKSYGKKAYADAVQASANAHDKVTKHIDKMGKPPSSEKQVMKIAGKEIMHAAKRTQGLARAETRLAKEDVGVKTPKTLRQFKEGWEEMMADVKKRAEPQPNGGSGVKQGSRYGGSKQKDKPEQDTDEKK